MDVRPAVLGGRMSGHSARCARRMSALAPGSLYQTPCASLPAACAARPLRGAPDIRSQLRCPREGHPQGRHSVFTIKIILSPEQKRTASTRRLPVRSRSSFGLFNLSRLTRHTGSSEKRRFRLAKAVQKDRLSQQDARGNESANRAATGSRPWGCKLCSKHLRRQICKPRIGSPTVTDSQLFDDILPD